MTFLGIKEGETGSVITKSIVLMGPQGLPSNAGGDEDILPTSIEGIIGALAKRGCTDLTSSIDLAACGDHPYAGGGFCDVYQGALHDGTSSAIKSSKVYGSQLNRDGEGQKVLKRAAKEIYHWSKLKHRNVLALMGLAVFKGYISMISGWVENGDLAAYLRSQPDADRIKLSIDICSGLCYIHMQGMVHGNLKGANVMVSRDGIAIITDFGNAQLKDLTLKFSNSSNTTLSIRWAA